MVDDTNELCGKCRQVACRVGNPIRRICREVLASFAEMRRVVKRLAAMRGDAADVISADGSHVSVPANSASALRRADVDLRRP